MNETGICLWLMEAVNPVFTADITFFFSPHLNMLICFIMKIINVSNKQFCRPLHSRSESQLIPAELLRAEPSLLLLDGPVVKVNCFHCLS